MNLDTLKDLLKQAEENNNSGNYDEAEKFAQTALAELENASDSGEDQALSERKTLHCTTLNLLATTNYQRGDLQAALSLALASLDIAEEYALSESKTTAWNVLGNVYTELDSYDKAFECFEQALATHKMLGNTSEAARVTGNIGILYLKLGSYDKALEFMEQALAAHKELGKLSFVARVTGNIGLVYQDLGSYDMALEFYEQALAAQQELGDKSGVARITGNIGNLYNSLCSYDKALDFMEQALAGHKELGDKSSVASVTGNIGSVFLKLGSYDKALEFFEQALTLHKQLVDKSGAAGVIGNIGSVYYFLGFYDKALEYDEQALATYKELGHKSRVVSITGNMGELYANKNYDGYTATIAEEFLNNAIALANEIGTKALLVGLHKTLANVYENEERWKEFAIHHKKYIELKDEVNIEETKKQDAIREQRKAVELAKAKHQATEQLLHNVLPPSIADKMLGGTKLIAEKIPSVSVLFADIVNFTKLSQRITPEELVEGLDRIFSTFDALAEKYGLEKIKTIGDAYMVVSGAPIQRKDHAEAMAHFALEMLEAMKEFRSISTGEEIQLRIGIHSGEVVAGVIGKKKFAYDLWGDAVNTASRMESHGEAGKIHVSEEFKHAVETLHATSLQLHATSLQFIRRGEMAIKGKGKMKTYFLEKL